MSLSVTAESLSQRVARAVSCVTRERNGQCACERVGLFYCRLFGLGCGGAETVPSSVPQTLEFVRAAGTAAPATSTRLGAQSLAAERDLADPLPGEAEPPHGAAESAVRDHHAILQLEGGVVVTQLRARRAHDVAHDEAVLLLGEADAVGGGESGSVATPWCVATLPLSSNRRITSLT